MPSFRYIASIDDIAIGHLHRGQAFEQVLPSDDFSMEVSPVVVEDLTQQFENLHWAMTAVRVEGGYMPYAVAANRVGFRLVGQNVFTDEQSVLTFASLYNTRLPLASGEIVRVLKTAMFGCGIPRSHAALLRDDERISSRR